MDEPEERQERLWTNSYDASYSDEDRTLSLVDNTSGQYEVFKLFPKANIFAELQDKLTKTDVDMNMDKLFDYLRKHPDMLKFTFDNEGKMSEIKVKRDTRLTFYDVSIKRLCDMSYYISEMLKILISNSNTDWQTKDKVKVVMDESNKNYCIRKGYFNHLVSKQSDTALSAGGHKSRRRHIHRRKPARKTRRGCTQKSKSKSKTHRRRRHSRVRKSKRNTYTSRR